MGNIHQMKVGNQPRGRLGALYGDPAHYREVSYGVSAGRTAQVATLEVDTAVQNDDYTVTIYGEELAIVGGATDTDTANDIKDAIEANPILAGLVEVSGPASDILTITARYPGIDIPIASSDGAVLPVTITGTAAEGQTVPFARAVVRGTDPETVRLPTVSDNSAALFIGVTRAAYDVAATAIGDSSSYGFAPGYDAVVVERGRVFVEGGDGATPTSNVYIGTAAGEEGKFYTASGTSRVQVTDGSVVWHSSNVIEFRKGL